MNGQLRLVLGWVALSLCACPVLGIGESAILEFLEELRARMCHPIPKFGLPALDPLQFSHVEYAADNQYLVDFTASATDFRLTGLSDFRINDLKISSVPLRRSTINVTMPLTAFKSLYTAKGSLAYIVNLSGDGNAEAAITEVGVAVSWVLKTGLTLGIRSLKVEITIGDLNVNFDDLFEEERINDFVHALINELGLELVNDVWVTQNAVVETVLEEKINDFIGQYTLADIIKIIGGSGDGPIFGPDDPPGDCKELSAHAYETVNGEGADANASIDIVPIN